MQCTNLEVFMRFIIGFIFFGLLFYTLSIYAPDTFQMLVSWAARTVDFIREQFARFSGGTGSPLAPPNHEIPKAVFHLIL